MTKPRYKSETCSWDRHDDECLIGPCEGCPWSYAEIERRRKLPLVQLPNGLMGKMVGQKHKVERS